MTYVIDDAGRSSACEILYACRGKVALFLRQEASRGHPDAGRLADLELVISQLRDDIVVVRAGNRTVTTRVSVMYGALVCAWHAPTPGACGAAFLGVFLAGVGPLTLKLIGHAPYAPSQVPRVHDVAQ